PRRRGPGGSGAGSGAPSGRDRGTRSDHRRRGDGAARTCRRRPRAGGSRGPPTRTPSGARDRRRGSRSSRPGPCRNDTGVGVSFAAEGAMELVVVAALFLATLFVGLYDTYSVQRAYADVYAQVHGHVPPLYEWFYTPDSHPDVDHWRKYH